MYPSLIVKADFTIKKSGPRVPNIVTLNAQYKQTILVGMIREIISIYKT